MVLMKAMNKNMNVTITKDRVIGRCKGPIKAILPAYEKRIEDIIATTVEPTVEGTAAMDICEDIDIEDYDLFCKWMIEKGGKPSIEEYKKAIEYYSSLYK